MRNTSDDLKDINLRKHHYHFAHNVLRAFCLNDTERFFSVMSKGNYEDYIDLMLEMSELNLGVSARDFPVRDIKVITCEVASLPAIIVVMPPTGARAEAHMVAIVMVDEETEDGSLSTIRFFTLEDAGGRTVLGEWIGEIHKGSSNGPSVDVDDFIHSLETRKFGRLRSSK